MRARAVQASVRGNMHVLVASAPLAHKVNQTVVHICSRAETSEVDTNQPGICACVDSPFLTLSSVFSTLPFALFFFSLSLFLSLALIKAPEYTFPA